MVTCSSPTDSGSSPGLPDVVPFDPQPLTRLSWELGVRVTTDDEASALCEWEHTGTLWMLSAFQVTSTTVVLRVRTPVGREQFYGTTRSGLESVLTRLDSTPAWGQC